MRTFPYKGEKWTVSVVPGGGTVMATGSGGGLAEPTYQSLCFYQEEETGYRELRVQLNFNLNSKSDEELAALCDKATPME